MKAFKTVMLLMFIIINFLAFSQQRGEPFTTNYKGQYYLRTQIGGDELSLKCNSSQDRGLSGSAYMSPQKNDVDMIWQFIPDKQYPGWYRLNNTSKNSVVCLECNDKESSIKLETTGIQDIQNVSGQLWRLELVSSKNGDYVYRLRSKLHGDKFSLEGGSKYGRTFMDNTQNVGGQMWRLISVK